MPTEMRASSHSINTLLCGGIKMLCDTMNKPTILPVTFSSVEEHLSKQEQTFHYFYQFFQEEFGSVDHPLKPSVESLKQELEDLRKEFQEIQRKNIERFK